MKKLTRKMAIIFAAALIVIMMAVPAFATTGNGYYEVGNASQYELYTEPIYVKVVISSRQYSLSNSTNINASYNVKVGTSSTTPQKYTVGDVLTALNTQQSDITAQTSNQQYDFTNAILYNMVKHTSTNDYSFESSLWGQHGYSKRLLLDGWMFRINGRLPLDSLTGDVNGGPWGADSVHTYVKDGDVIYFYMDHPWYENGTKMSTQFISADASYTPGATSSDNGTLTVQLYKTDDYFNDWTSFPSGYTFPWTINSYSSFAPGNQYSATIKEVTIDNNGNPVESNVGSVVLNTSGYGTKSIKLNSNGRYYIYVPAPRSWHQVTGYKYKPLNNTETLTVKHLARTMAYDKINF